MKENEIRERAQCANCEMPIGAAIVPLFFTVAVKRWKINVDAVKRQTGLAMMLGGHSQLAEFMGPNEDMASLEEEVEFTLCANCIAEALLLAKFFANGKEREGED